MTALDERPATRTGRPGRRPAPANPHWSDQGVCRSHKNPELWFPHSGELAKIREAKAICADCPVWVECRKDGIDGGADRSGIWGGLTESDRRKLRREAARKPGPGDADAQTALALYAACRPAYSTDANAITAVARRLRLPRPTVAAWIGPTRPPAPKGHPPNAIPPTTRADAVARYREIRAEHPSDVAAHRVVAAEYGVSTTSVWEWVKQDRRAARAAGGSQRPSEDPKPVQPI